MKIPALIRYLVEDRMYALVEGDLYRHDGSVVCSYNSSEGSWTSPDIRPEEMSGFTIFYGRGLPSLLVDRDLTNIGHTSVKSNRLSRVKK